MLPRMPVDVSAEGTPAHESSFHAMGVSGTKEGEGRRMTLMANGSFCGGGGTGFTFTCTGGAGEGCGCGCCCVW